MNKIRNRKFAWVALVLTMAFVGAPAVVAKPGTVYEFPFACPPMC